MRFFFFLLFLHLSAGATLLEDLINVEEAPQEQSLAKVKENCSALVTRTNEFIKGKGDKSPQDLIEVYIASIETISILQSYINVNVHYLQKMPLRKWGELYVKSGSKLALYLEKMRKVSKKLLRILLANQCEFDNELFLEKFLIPYITRLKMLIKQSDAVFLSNQISRNSVSFFTKLPQLRSLWKCKLVFMQRHGAWCLKTKNIFFKKKSALEVLGSQLIDTSNEKKSICDLYQGACEEIQRNFRCWDKKITAF